MKTTKKEIAATLATLQHASTDLERNSLRRGFAIALEETGPKARNEAMLEGWRSYYSAKAEERFP